MKKYELRKNHIEVSWNKRRTIKEGITLTPDDQYPEIIKEFESLEEAKAALEKYNTNIIDFSNFFRVEEYYIEDIESGDVLSFSKINIELRDEDTLDILAIFDNMSDAEDACDKHNIDGYAYLNF